MLSVDCANGHTESISAMAWCSPKNDHLYHGLALQAVALAPHIEQVGAQRFTRAGPSVASQAHAWVVRIQVGIPVETARALADDGVEAQFMIGQKQATIVAEHPAPTCGANMIGKHKMESRHRFFAPMVRGLPGICRAAAMLIQQRFHAHYTTDSLPLHLLVAQGYTCSKVNPANVEPWLPEQADWPNNGDAGRRRTLHMRVKPIVIRSILTPSRSSASEASLPPTLRS
jgi:hypothetical protein